MSWNRDRIGGLLLLTFFAGYGVASLEIVLPPVQQSAVFTAKTLPTALTVLGVLGGLGLVAFPPSREGVHWQGLRWLRAAAFLVLMSVYGLALRPMGFVAATLLFLAAGFVLLGERRPLPVCFVACSVTAAFWSLMHWGLSVYLAPWPSLWSN